jgi:hypothetical protein
MLPIQDNRLFWGGGYPQPRFSGKKCLLEIKKDELLMPIPVIIYTTSKEVDESKELRELVLSTS